MEWSYMVVRRYYRKGGYEAQIIARKDFSRNDFPENKEEYRQEFNPCANFEKAVKAMNFSNVIKNRNMSGIHR